MNAKTYLTAVADQIDAAIRDHDGPAVAAVIRRIAADGYPRVAATIARGLIAHSRRRHANKEGAGR